MKRSLASRKASFVFLQNNLFGMQNADFFVIIDEILAYIKKNHYLCSRFGCKDVTHACVRVFKIEE